MVGRIALSEFKSGWKGILFFSLLVIIISAGMPALFPTYRDSLLEELEGASNVSIEIPDNPDEMIELNWIPFENATTYFVLEDTRSSMVTADIIYSGTETGIFIDGDPTDGRYYAVMAVVDDPLDPILVGVATTFEAESPFDELLENPAFSAFTGGGNLSIFEVKGFVAFEFFSWWWMLSGLYIAYLSASIIASDIENKRIDIIFSAPISRRRYLIEKYLAIAGVASIILILAIFGLIAGLSGIDSLKDFPVETVSYSLISCFPFLLVIASFGTLTGAYFQKSRPAMGLTLSFVFVEFFLFAFGGFAKSLEWMKTISIFEYWNYSLMIQDNIFIIEDFLILLSASIIILVIGIRLFEKKDIPH
jgi:ABC-2 type transport system permease protein